MRLNLKLSHKGLILVSVPLIFELIFLATLTALLRQAESRFRGKFVLRRLFRKLTLFPNCSMMPAWRWVDTASPKARLFSDRYDKIVKQIPQDLDELRTLVGENGRQQTILANLKKITEDGLSILTEAKSAIDDNRVDVAQFRARHMYKEIRSLADRLQDELRGLTEDERN